MVRDEEASVLEWALYHHHLGFEAIIVVDHVSRDRTVENAKRAGEVVELIMLSADRTGPRTQQTIYQAVCRDFTDAFDWIAFLDIDEYLACREGGVVQDLLEANAGHAAIAVPWLMFGSSGHLGKPAGLTIEAYRRRAPVDFRPNHHVKMIVRPAAVRYCFNPHFFVVEGSTVLANGQPPRWESPGKLATIPEHSGWYVHHYFTRSRAHWTERLERGQLGLFTRTYEEFDVYDRNEVLDDSAARYGPAVRALIARVRA